MDGYLGRLLEKNVAVDGVMAQDAKQVSSLWAWREKIPESISKSGTAMTYDVAMEVPLLYKMVEDAKKHFGEKDLLGPGKLYSNLLGFGHVGDGVSDLNYSKWLVLYTKKKLFWNAQNLHIMANLKGFDHQGQEDMDEFVFDWTSKWC